MTGIEPRIGFMHRSHLLGMHSPERAPWIRVLLAEFTQRTRGQAVVTPDVAMSFGTNGPAAEANAMSR